MKTERIVEDVVLVDVMICLDGLLFLSAWVFFYWCLR
jgi:hypothetical protein